MYKLEFLLFCDQILKDEQTSKISAIGIFDSLTVSGVPAISSSITLLGQIARTRDVELTETTYVIKIRLEKGAGDLIRETELEVKFSKDTLFSNFFLTLVNMPVESLEKRIFKVFNSDAQLLATKELEVQLISDPA
jgi:hypothetical protein